MHRAIVLQAIEAERASYQLHATRAQPLASVTKILVSIAALEQLPKDYHFRTQVVSSGPVNAQGMLPNLILIGGGSFAMDEP